MDLVCARHGGPRQYTPRMGVLIQEFRILQVFLVCSLMKILYIHYKPTSLVYGPYTGEGSYTGLVVEIFLIRAPCTGQPVQGTRTPNMEYFMETCHIYND